MFLGFVVLRGNAFWFSVLLFFDFDWNRGQ